MPDGGPIGAEGQPPGGSPIGAAHAATTGGSPIGPGEAAEAGGLPIRSGTVTPAGGRPVMPEPEFGLPGASILAPGAYFGGEPVGGPASIFNIGGAPIAILGGVFSGGLPIGGPTSQVFRSGAPIPNTLFIITLEPGGPIGEFFIGNQGAPIGGTGIVGAPIGLNVAGEPIGTGAAIAPGGGLTL